jgi:hypothetical protein
MRVHLAVTAVVLSVFVVACGDDGGSTTAADGTVAPSDPTRRLQAEVTVLESPEHGPQLCLGGVEDSLPPQCGGPDVLGWSWEDVPWRDTAAGTTWADVHVVGTYDGTTFTLTETPTEAVALGSPGPAPDFTAPCPEPDGGWAVRDPARISAADEQAMWEHANAQPDIAASWIDQQSVAGQTIVVVAFTGDVERHRADLESRWGGLLCVTQMAHPRAELRDVQHRATADDDLGVLGSWVDEMRNRVVLFVTVADERVLQLVHDRYGELVEVEGALQPVE